MEDLKISQTHPLELQEGKLRPREKQQLSQGLNQAILSPDLKAMAGPQPDLTQRHGPQDLLRYDLAL